MTIGINEATLAKVHLTQAALSELSDEDLVRLSKIHKLKDDRPFAVLYRRHRRDIWGICYSFFRNAHDAEEIMQEVFFKAFRGIDQFEGRASFRTWLNRIATNACINEVRRRQIRPPIHEMEFDYLAGSVLDEDAVEALVEERAESAIVMLAMSHLRREDQVVIHMKEIEELTYEEIAQALAISLSATKMRVLRARSALRAAYIEEKSKEQA